MSERQAFRRIVEIVTFEEINFLNFFNNSIGKERCNLFFHKSLIFAGDNEMEINLIV